MQTIRAIQQQPAELHQSLLYTVKGPMESIENILTLEVKYEIANRYFGFRRIIEKDSEDYLQEVRAAAENLETTVGHELVRIYHLLHRQDLLDRFFSLTGIPEGLFYDAYINTEPIRRKIIAQQNFRGLTRKRCLHNLFFDAYGHLYEAIIIHRENCDSLQEEQQIIREQIRIFYRKNDINSIFNFLRSLEGTTTDLGPANFSNEYSGSLEAKLQLEPPLPVEDLLPQLPLIPSVKMLRRDLKALVNIACDLHSAEDLNNYRQK